VWKETRTTLQLNLRRIHSTLSLFIADMNRCGDNEILTVQLEEEEEEEEEEEGTTQTCTNLKLHQ
jgi:hypothetical protein